MALLDLQSVRMRHGSRVVLDNLSLAVEAGEMVVVWGERRSGRSTLLRVACGIETPDAGLVRFAGRDLTGREDELLRAGVAYCRRTFRSSAGRIVLEHLISGQYARRTPRSTALRRAWACLERVGASQCTKLRPSELSPAETVRVAIARALTCAPRMLVIDEPTIGVELTERDEILRLLRSLADEGVAVLGSTGEGTGLLGADRVLVLRNGALGGETAPSEPAPVADLDRHRRAHG